MNGNVSLPVRRLTPQKLPAETLRNCNLSRKTDSTNISMALGEATVHLPEQL